MCIKTSFIASNEQIKPLVERKKCIFRHSMEKILQKGYITENKVIEKLNHFNVRSFHSTKQVIVWCKSSIKSRHFPKACEPNAE